MTRLKKLLIAGLMVLVTTCVSMSSMLFNISQSIFSLAKIEASAYSYSNFFEEDEHNPAEFRSGDILSIEKIPTTRKVNEDIDIPLSLTITDIAGNITSYGNDEIFVEIRNPYNKILFSEGESKDLNQVIYDPGDPGDPGDPKVPKLTLKPAQIGVYTIQYAFQNSEGVFTLTDIYNINITAESYTMEFMSNNPIIMPEKLDTNPGVDKTITLPLPLFYDNDGNQITKFVLGCESLDFYYLAEYVKLTNVWLDENNSPVVFSPTDQKAVGKNVFNEYYTYEITKKTSPVIDAEYGLAIEVKVGGAVLKNVLQDPLAPQMLTLNYDSDLDYYIDMAYNFIADSGKNFITYKLCNTDFSNQSTPFSYISQNFDGSNSFDSSKIEIGATVSTYVKESDMSLNEKTYLSAVSAIDKNNNKNAVNAYYYYNIAYIDTDDNDKEYTTPDKVELGIDDKGLYFIPHVKGNYNIYYNAVDFYGNIDKNADTYEYRRAATDKTSPSYNLVKSYNYNNFSKTYDETDYSYIIPTKYVINTSEDPDVWTEIVVPAIFAKDNVSSFGELKIQRSITSTNGFIDKDENTIKNCKLYIQTDTGETKYGDSYSSKISIPYTDIISFKPIAKNSQESQTFYIDDDGVFRNNEDDSTLGSGELNDYALEIAKSSQVAYLKLNPKLFTEGTYTIEYSVSDGVYLNNTGKTFTFELVNKDPDNPIDTEAPEVEFSTSTIGNVVNKQKITLAKPSIKDNVDTNLCNRYFIFVGPNETIDDDTYFEIFPDENGNFVFLTSMIIHKEGEGDEIIEHSIYDLAKKTPNKSFKIIAFSYDDFADIDIEPETIELSNYPADSAYANIGISSYEITIYDLEDDKPVIIAGRTDVVEHENENAEYNQFDRVSVNGIVYYDNTRDARISVKIVDSSGISYSYEQLPGYKITKLSEGSLFDQGYFYEYYFPGVSFVPNKSDNYTITYSIIDKGNNATVYCFVLRQAKDKEAPVITSLFGTTATIQLGDTHNQEVSAIDNKTSSDKINFEPTCAGPIVGERPYAVYNEDLKRIEFTPEYIDVYTITVTAYDHEENLSAKSFEVKVIDSLAPTLKLIGSEGDDIIFNEGKDEFGEELDWDEENFPEVKLPGFIVVDEYQSTGFEQLGATGKLTITTPSNKTYVFDMYGDPETESAPNPLNISFRSSPDTESNYFFYFTPSERGHYTATYSGADLNKNASNSKTINVYVGDTVLPEIFITEKLSSTLSKGFVVGDTDKLIINPRARIKGDSGYSSQDLYLYDNYGFNTLTEDEGNIDYVVVSIYIVDENNNPVHSIENESNYVYYQFKTAGIFTVTFTVSDSVGNPGTLSKTFKVTAKATSTTDTTKILGTVLIIVSIVILAGVVIYFIRGTKLLPKRSKRKSKKNISKDKE